MSQVLAITGRVLPVTTADVQLEAEFENGASVIGESKIFYCKKKEDCRITKVRLIPEHPRALPEALPQQQTALPHSLPRAALLSLRRLVRRV